MKRSYCCVSRCLLVVLLLGVWAGSIVHADDAFEYHAYIRSGVLQNGEGGKGTAFQAPGAYAKYRLGNEAETYGEAILVKNFNQQGEGPAGKVETLLAYKTYQDNQWSADTDEFTVREAFAQIERLAFAPEAKLWAGNRFYRRMDIHIDDFYWLDTSGYGGGIEDLPLGDDLRLHLAYLRGSPENAPDIKDVGFIAKQTIDLRLSGIPVGFGDVELVALLSHVKGGTYESTLTNGDEERTITTEVDSTAGVGLAAIHSKNYESGFNKFAVQWGNSVAKDFSSALWAAPGKVSKDSWLFRALDFGVFQPNDNWAMMYVGILQTTDNGEDENNRQDWYSLGVRPVYYFNKNFSIALEAGVDYTRQEGAGTDGDDLDGMLGKLTLCPQVALDNTFFARPVLRAFITLAKWSDDFEGQIGGSEYATDTFGLNYGVQMEAWF